MAHKPAHDFQTRSAVAFRQAAPLHPAFASDPRALGFALRFPDGRVGQLTLGLHVQHADSTAASDPDLSFAVKAWLCTRGQRHVNLWRVDGDHEAELLASGAFEVSELGTAADGCGRRLITLCPSNVELVDALDCFERVVACDVSSDYPSGVHALERLGHDLAPDLERIVALLPDLVISSLTVPGMERVVTGLHARGVPQLVLAPRSFQEVLAGTQALARALGCEARGEALVARLRAEAEALRAALPKERVRVYLEWWPKPMFTPGKDCYSNELIELAGGINVFAQRSGASVQIEAAELFEAAPEICFVSWCGVSVDKLDPEKLRTRAGLEELKAVREGHVYALSEEWSGRPGPRMLEAARIMARAIAAL